MNRSEKLAQLRKEKGLTQIELARELNVTRQAVSRWEVGDAIPSTENLKRLSELYGVSLEYLLNDEQQEREKRPDPEPAKEDAEKDGKERKNKWKVLAICALLALGVVSAALAYTVTREKPDEHRGVISEIVGEEIGELPTITFDVEDW